MNISLLTDRQRAELNKSILAYVSLHVGPETAKTLRRELVDPIDLQPIAEQDPESTRKQAQVLEKKWTSVVRLQRKVLDLESQLADLRTELDTAGSRPHAQNNSSESWLPRTAKLTLSGHRQPITGLDFSPTFSLLASAGEDGTVRVWDWQLGEVDKIIKAHTKSVLDVAFGGPPDRLLLASCSSDLTIKLWDPQNDYANVQTLTGHDHTISSVRFTPSGTHLISGSRDKTVRVWDVSTGFAVRTIRTHADWVKCVRPSGDGRYILSAGIDQQARVSGFAESESVKALTLVGHDHVIECAVFAPPTASRHLAALEGLKQPVESVYADSFQYIATGSRDKTIKLWNTRGEPFKTLVGHDNWVRGLVFHPGGRYLLSVSDDRAIKCWDLAQQGRCVKTLADAHHHFISCIAWAPQAAVVATASVDLDVKVWA